jgi:hypothetical protein
LKKFSLEARACLTITGTNFASCQRVTESRTRRFPDDPGIGFRPSDLGPAETDDCLFMDLKPPVALV